MKASKGVKMPVHIFVVDETNYDICIRKGLAAIPNNSNLNINDALISRMALIKKDDLILFYVTGKKELRGIFRALEFPFFDLTKVWEPKESQFYPFRVRIDNSEYSFQNPISLSDIYDLKDQGIIWTFALRRPGSQATNSMFAITNIEYKELFNLFLKLNPHYSQPKQIKEPYPYFEPNLLEILNLNSDLSPKYENSLMALILNGLSKSKFKEIFGNYSDYISYVPTSFEKEIDILLIFNSPVESERVIAYNIIEVKRDEFDEKGLSQLLQYEDWFLRKKVNGDFSMVRTTAIAKSFSTEVKEYLTKRKKYEGKEILLLRYENKSNGVGFEEENL